MEAHAKTIRQILESGSRFLIPLFPRSYSWRKGDDDEALEARTHSHEVSGVEHDDEANE